MDVLGDAIAALRAGPPHAALGAEPGAWGVRFPHGDLAGFHAVVAGSCWFRPADAAPVELRAGDLVFAPRAAGHGLSAGPATRLTDVPAEAVVTFAPPPGEAPAPPGEGPGDQLPAGAGRGREPGARLLCGAYGLDPGGAHPLLGDLPPYVTLRAGDDGHAEAHAALGLLAAELAGRRPAGEVAVTALLDLLFAHLMRVALAASAEATAGGAGPARGWAAALADPVVGAALGAMHARPEAPWTVESLARHAGASRAVFARRFAALTGHPPLAYLTWWRMVRAGRLLTEGEADAALAVVARRVGYRSEFAFAKAFKRHHGTTPGRYRSRPLRPRFRQES